MQTSSAEHSDPLANILRRAAPAERAARAKARLKTTGPGAPTALRQQRRQTPNPNHLEPTRQQPVPQARITAFLETVPPPSRQVNRPDLPIHDLPACCETRCGFRGWSADPPSPGGRYSGDRRRRIRSTTVAVLLVHRGILQDPGTCLSRSNSTPARRPALNSPTQANLSRFRSPIVNDWPPPMDRPVMARFSRPDSTR